MGFPYLGKIPLALAVYHKGSHKEDNENHSIFDLGVSIVSGNYHVSAEALGCKGGRSVQGPNAIKKTVPLLGKEAIRP